MARIVPLAVVLFCVGCSSGTVLDVTARSLPGATVVYPYGGEPLVLDAHGEGSIVISPGIVPNWAGDPIPLDVTRDGLTVHLFAECVPPFNTRALDGVTFLIRRKIATGDCALIQTEDRVGSDTTHGAYDPTKFDDAPCGPWH